MKLYYVIIYVDDAVEATKFYEKVFGMKTKFIHESKMYAEMESGETTLAFANNEMLKINIGIDALKGTKNCFEIAFSTDDERVISLIFGFLKSGIKDHDHLGETSEGTPQGGPLSPLLANLMLDQMDKELELRGHRFVRYADDLNIYVKSKRAGRRVLKSVSNYLSRRMKLKINEAKSLVRLPWIPRVGQERCQPRSCMEHGKISPWTLAIKPQSGVGFRPDSQVFCRFGTAKTTC